MTTDESEPHVNSKLPDDERQLAEFFDQHRSRLRRMVRLRLDRRLQGRVDPSDVIQDAYAEASQRFAEYQKKSEMPLFLWLRFLTSQKLLQVHRHHLRVQARDAQRDVSIYAAPLPEASSAALAAQLVGQRTSPSEAAARAELKLQIRDALNTMDAHDREVLAMRHFEQLSNAETARELEIQESAASKRYLRAIKRLRQTLSKLAGLSDLA